MRRLALAAPLMGLLVVAGCSDDSPDPQIAPTPTDTSSAASTATPDPTPTGPVEPTLPPEAEGTDAAAAEAFVEFYWEMVNYAQATGDVIGLRGLGSEACEACAGGLESIVETYDRGGSISGGVVTVANADAREITSRVGRAYVVEIAVETTDQVVEIPGDKGKRNQGGSLRMQFVVQSIDGTWLAGRWEVLE